jgi:hypothetical protein
MDRARIFVKKSDKIFGNIENSSYISFVRLRELKHKI